MSMLRVVSDAITSCATCPVGVACEVGHGGRCTLVDRSRKPGELIFLEGELVTTVWFIKRGSVLLTRAQSADADGESARVVRREGSFLGLEGLIGRPYLDSARALTEVKICGAALGQLDGWLGPPTAPARMALTQTLRMLAAEAPRAAAPDGSALRRVARWLTTPAAAQAEVPRRDVASMLGMTPETLSRALAQLARRGVIALTRRSIDVMDRAQLATLAEASRG